MGNAASQPEEEARLMDTTLPSALVVVGPSGVGKGTLINKLMEGNDKFGFSCSHTTRQPRPGEENGVHYHFTTKEDFESGIAQGQFLEYAYVHSNIYGTSIKAVEDVALSGRCCVLDIDVQGARQVRASGLRAVFVFVAPPSMEELEQRLRGRGTEAEEQITTRLNNAKQEMASVDEAGLYDYIVVNDNLDRCLEELKVVAGRALAGQVGKGQIAPVAGPPEFSGAASLQNWLGDGTAATASPPESSRRAGADGWGVGPLSVEQWRGKVALVTGAGVGVGWTVSLMLAAAGVKVVAISSDKDELERLQDAAVDTGVNPTDFLPVVCDLTKEGEVLALPRIVTKRWPTGGIDILVNAASVQREDDDLAAGSTSSWVEMASINILGAAMVSREAVQDMDRRSTWGHIVHVAGGIDTSISGGFFNVTSHALRAMAQELRKEAKAKGVPLRVSCVCPGIQSKEEESLGVGLTAEDVAQAVMWCLAAPAHVDASELHFGPTSGVIRHQSGSLTATAAIGQ